MPVNIIINCIDNDIEIGSRPVDAGLTNLGRISGSNTEDNIPGEGKIFYDIRFSAYYQNAEIKILINVEAQKSSDPAKLGYHLENRIVFYLARMISAQKQTEFYHSDYDSLKKVRSIWICMDNSETGDSIEEIYMDKKTIFGKSERPLHPDLMKGIIINIRNGQNKTESKNTLISMLEKLLSQIDTDEKKRLLSQDYGLIMTEELEGRLRIMCNLSENIENIGIEKGIEKERTDAIKRMLKVNVSKEQILSYGYTEEEFKKAQTK